MFRAALASLLAMLVLAGAAGAAGTARMAAVQHALRVRGVYAGAIDGVAGPQTTDALRRFQASVGLFPSGTLDPQTQRALGLVKLGSRLLARGASGSDVLQLQFLLAWHGFPSGDFDAVFNDHVEKALVKFQRWGRLEPDGIAGASTLAALRGPLPECPIALSWPINAPVSDPFGPRGVRFHSGVDIPADIGTIVGAAAAGRVAYAAFLPGGWGQLVSIDNGSGVRTLYAHLSRIDVQVGQHVQTGEQIGLVGATGDATGPHLHFEVRFRDAAVDPLKALPQS